MPLINAAFRARRARAGAPCGEEMGVEIVALSADGINGDKGSSFIVFIILILGRTSKIHQMCRRVWPEISKKARAG